VNKLRDCPCKGSNLDKIVQPAILAALVKEELHGYKVIQRVAASAMFNGNKPDPTGIYRHLKIMESNGLIISRWETVDSAPAKRIFKITANGYDCLRTWIQTLEEYKSTIETFLYETKSVFNNSCISEKKTNGGSLCLNQKLLSSEGF